MDVCHSGYLGTGQWSRGCPISEPTFVSPVAAGLPIMGRPAEAPNLCAGVKLSQSAASSGACARSNALKYRQFLTHSSDGGNASITSSPAIAMHHSGVLLHVQSPTPVGS